MTTNFTYDVFISYARKDGAEKAEALANALRANGFRVYYDLYQNEPGIDWWQRIETAITRAKSFVFILTSGSVTSSVCADEWKTAELLNRPILPVNVVDSGGKIIPDSDIPAHISRIHYIDTVKNWDAGIDDISHFLTRYEYLYELADDLARSVSENTARRFIEIIGKENAEAKKPLKRRMRVRTTRGNSQTERDFSSLSEAWEAYDGQVLLLGQPGAGKTTTLLHHAQHLIRAYLADRNQPVPVFATIAFWDSYADTPLHEWLPEHNELSDDMRDVILHGRAVLILDGLDELGRSKPINPEKPEEGTFDPRQRFMAQVQKAIHDGNQVLMTCRVDDYKAIGDKLDIRGAIELQKLTDAQIETYLGDVPTVQATVMADADLLEICRSPLLLSLIAFGYRDATDNLKALPSMTEGDLRDAIFGQYIQASYDFEASRRELLDEDMPFTLDKVLDVLGHAAMINVAGGERDDKAGDIIENILIHHDFTHKLEVHEVDNFLAFITHLNVIEPDEDGHYRFLHLLIRDYLAFRYAIAALQSDELYSSQNWRNGNGTGSFVLGCLINLNDDRSAPTLLNKLANSPKPAVRLGSARVLGKTDSEQAVPILMKRLQQDEDAWVRGECARALGNIGNEQAVPALGERLQQDEDAEVRWTCVISLDRIGSDQAVSALINALQEDENFVVRRACVRSLDRIGSEDAVLALIDALQKDDNADVRSSCARALGTIGSEQAVAVLINALQDTEKAGWRGTVAHIAAEALEKIGTPEALQAVAEWRKQKQEQERKQQAKAQVSGDDDYEYIDDDDFYDDDDDDDELGSDWRSRLGKPKDDES